MKFLVDQNLSTILADKLRDSGHDVIHVQDVGLSRAEDKEIFELALKEDRVIITADQDFGQILAESGTNRPSVIRFVGRINRRAVDQADVILHYLEQITAALEAGVVAVLNNEKRIKPKLRSLPIKK